MNKYLIILIIIATTMFLMFSSFKLGEASVDTHWFELRQCNSKYMYCELDLKGAQHVLDNLEEYDMLSDLK